MIAPAAERQRCIEHTCRCTFFPMNFVTGLVRLILGFPIVFVHLEFYRISIKSVTSFTDCACCSLTWAIRVCQGWPSNDFLHIICNHNDNVCPLKWCSILFNFLFVCYWKHIFKIWDRKLVAILVCLIIFPHRLAQMCISRSLLLPIVRCVFVLVHSVFLAQTFYEKMKQQHSNTSLREILPCWRWNRNQNQYDWKSEIEDPRAFAHIE